MLTIGVMPMPPAMKSDFSAASFSAKLLRGPAMAVEATGVPELIRACIEVVASSGRVVIVGISEGEVTLPVIAFTRKELTIVGSRNNTGLFGQAVDLVRRHRDRLRPVITHRFPLEQTPDAVRFAIAHPAEAEKVMILVDQSLPTPLRRDAGALA